MMYSIFSTIHMPVTAPSPWMLVVAIILATFVHEDLATIAVGIAVAGGLIETRLALPALYAGIVLGDLGLYGLGRLAALNRFSVKLLSRTRFTAFKAWLDQRLVLGVFIVRFLPGLRLSAYTTYGFFAMPFTRFLVSVVLAASIWTTGLFYLSYAFGELTEHWLGYWRWLAIVLAFAMPLLLLRRFTRAPNSVETALPEKDAGAM